MSHLYEHKLANTGYSMEEQIEQNMGLVIKTVNEFRPKNEYDKDNYIQAGRIGLWKAIKKYDSSIGCKFSPFARNAIRWEIIRHIANENKHNEKIQYHSGESMTIYDRESNYGLIDEYIPDSLTDEELRIIVLQAQGCTLSEIAKNVNRTTRYTKNLFMSAIDKIRESNEKQKGITGC